MNYFFERGEFTEVQLEQANQVPQGALQLLQ